MVVVATLSEVDIISGNFILAKVDDTSNDVRRVISISLPHSVEVVWWREAATAPPLCPNLYENVIRSRINELSADGSATLVISCACIVDIACLCS
jgi:hypothetical protein